MPDPTPISHTPDLSGDGSVSGISSQGRKVACVCTSALPLLRVNCSAENNSSSLMLLLLMDPVLTEELLGKQDLYGILAFGCFFLNGEVKSTRAVSTTGRAGGHDELPLRPCTGLPYLTCMRQLNLFFAEVQFVSVLFLELECVLICHPTVSVMKIG